MMRSLYSGVSGLRTHQTRMDVIGNNIANVNTVGFKSQSATFQELMYQTTSNASGANAETGRGGINAKQIGLGTSLDTIKKDNVSALKIMSAENMVSEPAQTTEGYVSGIVDKNSDQLSSESGQIFNISFYDSLGYSYVGKYALFNFEDDASSTPLTDGIYRLKLTDVIDSEGTSITKQADGTTVKLNTLVTINPNNTTDETASETLYVKYDNSTGSFVGWNSDGGATWNEVTANADNKIQMSFNTTTMPSFSDNNGKLNISFKTSTMYDNNGTSTVSGKAGDYDGVGAGRKVGTMSGVAVQQDGKIYASYDNGTTKLLGQIAVASFANPSGLEKVGDNLYITTQNSGEFDGIGQDVTQDGIGKMSTGVLEMSNVDLSQEFTEMITTQRGFQANSRIITVSDSMLEELTNLKR